MIIAVSADLNFAGNVFFFGGGLNREVTPSWLKNCCQDGVLVGAWNIRSTSIQY